MCPNGAFSGRNSSPPLCFNGQKVLKHLLRAGLSVPLSDTRFVDPRVMGWLVESNEHRTLPPPGAPPPLRETQLRDSVGDTVERR